MLFPGYWFSPGVSEVVIRCDRKDTWLPDPLTLFCNRISCPNPGIGLLGNGLVAQLDSADTGPQIGVSWHLGYHLSHTDMGLTILSSEPSSFSLALLTTGSKMVRKKFARLVRHQGTLCPVHQPSFANQFLVHLYHWSVPQIVVQES